MNWGVSNGSGRKKGKVNLITFQEPPRKNNNNLKRKKKKRGKANSYQEGSNTGEERDAGAISRSREKNKGRDAEKKTRTEGRKREYPEGG